MKQKILAFLLCLILLLSLGACTQNGQNAVQESTNQQTETTIPEVIKTEVTVKVVAESKSFSKDYTVQTEKSTLGELLEEIGIATYSEGAYGKYITGMCDIVADDSNQEWWSVLVNGEFAQTGVDAVALNSGDTYTFELKIGY